MKLVLFDVDGTLAPSGKKIEQPMIECLSLLKTKCDNIELGIVGGGSYNKICWQLDIAKDMFRYVFSECGAVVHIDGKLTNEKNMLELADRDILNNIIRTAFIEIASMPIIYHGCQMDFRKGLIYISPPGIQATDYERNIFAKADKEFDLRKKLIEKLLSIDNVKDQYEITIGGHVGIAVYPKGWDKSQVIDMIPNIDNLELYFFGDKTEPEGNDYPIYSHPRVKGYSVTDPNNTIEIIEKLWL